jgi:hypothetical protein
MRGRGFRTEPCGEGEAACPMTSAKAQKVRNAARGLQFLQLIGLHLPPFAETKSSCSPAEGAMQLVEMRS